jgi:hypothetical protein
MTTASMTRFVVTECCAAPVRLAHARWGALCADVVCAGCGRVAGTPGCEDSSEVGRFVLDFEADRP